MNKRKLHHHLKNLMIVRSGYFLAAALLFLAIGAYGLRQNNAEAIKLRDEVIKADNENGDVETPLRKLREHIYSHMNANLSGGTSAIKQPVQLKARYERLAAAEAEKVKAQNIEVQKTAEAICGQRFPAGGFNSARVSCTADYMRDHAAKEGSVPSDLYKFDFVSPAWTPDTAGLSLLAALLLFVIFIVRLAVGWWYKHEL